MLATVSLSQSVITLCGTVTNATGSPVPGVSVKLQKKNLTAVSGPDGKYCINWNAGVSLRQGSIPPAPRCALSGKRLSVALSDGDRFNAGLFDLRGRTLWVITKPSWAAGRHEVTLPLNGFSHQSGILKVNVGPARYSFRVAECGGETFLFSDVKASETGRSLEKPVALLGTFPIQDTLVATGQGFARNNVIRSYVYLFVDTIDFSLGEPDTFSEARQQIVHRVNDYRATLALKRLIRNKSMDACVDTQAQLDFAANTAHSAFGHCKESAQNECPGWTGTNMLLIANTIVVSCLQMMWDEGPGTPYSAHGHYINMTNTAYSKIACGFYYDIASKTMWAAHDFF